MSTPNLTLASALHLGFRLKLRQSLVLVLILFAGTALLTGLRPPNPPSFRGTVSDPSGAVVPEARVSPAQPRPLPWRLRMHTRAGGHLFASLARGPLRHRVQRDRLPDGQRQACRSGRRRSRPARHPVAARNRKASR